MYKNIDNIKIAYDKGYRVIEGKVISPNGLELTLQYCGNRPRFRMRNGKKPVHVYVARLAGYQKFGEKLFDENLHLCHINGNPRDNNENNLKLGTFSEAQDTKEVFRKELYLKEKTEQKETLINNLVEMRSRGISYEEIMKIAGIKSKKTLIKLIINENKSR